MSISRHGRSSYCTERAKSAELQRGAQPMKYVLLFGETKERAKQWEAMPEAQRLAAYAPINQWFGKDSRKITGGHALQHHRTATTVKFNNGKPVVTDGPFIEGKESIGGYAEVTVADLDEALEMAKSWPAGGPVEVRPVVDRGEPQR